MALRNTRMGLGLYKLTLSNNTIIDEAIKRGITFFDTSDSYGESEIALGEKLKQYNREKMIICTKVGVRLVDERICLDGSPEYIFSACDASLKNLQTNYIDYYLLHRCDPRVPIETSVKALKTLVDSDKVKFIGLSEVTASQIRRAHEIHPISVVQIEYSPWSKQDESNDVIKTCRELGIAIVIYSPLGRAFFTQQSCSYFQSLPQADFRKLLPRYSGENLETNLKAKTLLQKYADSKNYTLPQLVLAWEIAKGLLPIPACTTVEHLDDNIKALGVRLSQSEMDEIDNLINRCHFAGPRYPNTEISAIYPEKPIPGKKPARSSWTKPITLGLFGLTTLCLFARIAQHTKQTSSMMEFKPSLS